MAKKEVALVALKKFIDGRGRRISVGDPLPSDYSKDTLAHYERFGMVGEAVKPKKGPTEKKPVGPDEGKPATPDETKGEETGTDTDPEA